MTIRERSETGIGVEELLHTHYSQDLAERAAEGGKLCRHTVQFQAIIEMSLMRELGFSHDTIDHILDRVQRYARIHHYMSVDRGDG